ncbi:MAG: hypothetical protein AB7C91_00160 [Sphaerochaeta sp.]|uniref:hypothetical protein n=1 Tax=Sphaerochaeta sp. TaxID=1972642 RepID=UPI003D0E18CD
MKWFIILLCCCLLCACDVNPLEMRIVKVVLDQPHPWAEAAHHPLWNTLVYTAGGGVRTSVHMKEGETELSVPVSRDHLTIFCAYPLSSLNPYGGFWYPGSGDTVRLSQEEGKLAGLLLNVYPQQYEAVERVVPSSLFTALGDPGRYDASSLLMDLLSGSFVAENLIRYPYLSVILSDLPQGYWVAERIDQTSFWSIWDKSVTLDVDSGVQRWWNKERSLCLTLFADLKAQRYLTSLGKAPLW